MSSRIAELKRRVRGRVLVDEPLARHTTYRIGGPARALVLPGCTGDVVSVVEWCSEVGVDWIVLGLGSNVLVSDGGFDGVVLKLGKGMDEVRDVGPEMLRVGAGLPTPRLARRTATAGLAGVHRLIGIPGTVGGGVTMNAGAHGQDFSQVVRSVEIVGPSGSVIEVAGEEIEWRYRESGLHSVIVLSAVLALSPDDPDRLDRELQELLRRRKKGTPFDEPCCGSVFRNPANSGSGEMSLTAGQLIDSTGLKGFRVGGAQVSHKHANYIVNTGKATEADVRAVIGVVRDRVLSEHGVELELEVRMV